MMKTPRKQSDDSGKPVSKLLFSLALVGGEIFLIRVIARHLSGNMMADFGTSLIMLGAIVTGGIVLSILWTPQISELLFRPLTSLFDGGNTEPDRKPGYSIAISKRKQGKFLEAVVEIRRQLARFPNDMEGMMLLASIQAEDLKDLPAAEIALNHFCSQPHPPPKQFAAAMNQLADWQLKLAQDADAARAALEKIIARFPDSVMASLAAQRIGHLKETERNLLAAQDRQPVAVPEGVKNLGLLKTRDLPGPAEAVPEHLAADYVKHLEQHPLDMEARAQLAVLYADQYHRLDLATDQLEQMIGAPNQPPKRVVHWLNLLADLQVRHGADYDTVRQTLERIVERFPDWAAAEMARSRLSRLKLELKGQPARSAIKLGVYEQNLGLKHGRPGQR